MNNPPGRHLIASFAAVRRHLRELPLTAGGALAAFEAAVFSPRVENNKQTEADGNSD